MYSLATGNFEETLQAIPRIAYKAQCGTATAADGSRMVVVAGGTTSATGTSTLADSWIYSLASSTWVSGPPLPTTLRIARVVPTETSFYITGGRDHYNYDTDMVLEFDPIGMDWIIRNETLDIARYEHHAIEVDIERFCE